MRSLAITMGDPRGVGPQLALEAAAAGLVRDEDVVFASLDALHAVARALPRLEPALERVRARLVQCSGQVEAIHEAARWVRSRDGLALLTGPIDKAAAAAEGLEVPGHTELLGQLAGAPQVAMLMAGPVLRVTLATVHLPLSQVPARLSRPTIEWVAQQLAITLLREYRVEAPRIGLFGLNPHAGERGLLGREDEELIAPAVEALASSRAAMLGAVFSGPLAADTAIVHHAHGDLDGVVAMYHDQGLAPFKLLHFDDGINTTLGLPYVRTSPDHGTASNIAGTDAVRTGSYFAALRYARGGAMHAWPDAVRGVNA